jgi:uncharacterized lipoprotein YmbA
MRTCLVLALALILAGCATPGAVVVTCLPLRAYTPAEQDALADALAAVPSNSPLVGAMADYLAMRDADRACLAGRR